MKMRQARYAEPLFVAFAALGTLGFTQLHASPESAPDQIEAASEQAMVGLISAEAAAEAGAWWLEEPATSAALSASLSFDPDHDRLVWRVSGSESLVLLDAATGEALEFEFDPS